MAGKPKQEMLFTSSTLPAREKHRAKPVVYIVVGLCAAFLLAEIVFGLGPFSPTLVRVAGVYDYEYLFESGIIQPEPTYADRIYYENYPAFFEANRASIPGTATLIVLKKNGTVYAMHGIPRADFDLSKRPFLLFADRFFTAKLNAQTMQSVLDRLAYLDTVKTKPDAVFLAPGTVEARNIELYYHGRTIRSTMFYDYPIDPESDIEVYDSKMDKAKNALDGIYTDLLFNNETVLFLVNILLPNPPSGFGAFLAFFDPESAAFRT